MPRKRTPFAVWLLMPLALSAMLIADGTEAARIVIIETTPSDLESTVSQMTSAELEATFNLYMTAWRQRNFATQSDLVAPDFYYRDQSKVQNRSEYLENKRRLYNKYPWILVEVSGLQLQTSGDHGIASFRLHFKSPSYESYGDQTMTFRKLGGRVELVSEEFRKYK